MERRALQVVLAVLSLIPLAGLTIGFGFGSDFFMGDGPRAPAGLDNQYRYLCGVYTTVTIGLWYAIPAIERRGEVVRIVGAGVFLGAIGRLLSMRSHGDPGYPTMNVGVFLEGIGVPLLILWQARIARIYRRRR